MPNPSSPKPITISCIKQAPDRQTCLLELGKKLRKEEKIKEIKNEKERNKEAKNQGTIMNSLSCLAAAVAEIFYFFPH